MATLAEQARHLKPRPGRLPRLILVTDAERLPDPRAAIARLAVGSALIFRHYGVAVRTALALDLAKICRARRLRLLIAGDLSLALRCGAGLHLPEAMAREPAAKIRLWHRQTGRLLTVAAHGRAALVRARGADAALLSPVFTTASHPDARSLGPLAFRRLVRNARLPVYALGGINARTIRHLKGSGAAGAAALAGFG